MTTTTPPVRWRRLQLVELEDQPWFPAVLRDAGTSFLRFMVSVSGHARHLAPKVAEALERSGQDRLVDLCAGGGGPLPVILAELRRLGHTPQAVVTDLYPNRPAFERLAQESGGQIVPELRPVDASAVPADLRGLRVIFNAFHHLPPPLARQVLQDAARAGQPIAIFEVVSREPLSLLGMFLAPLNFVLTLPFLRPFQWSWVLWTLLPVLPLFVLWDGVVSWLRIYSEPELHELVAGLDAPGWTWEIGRTRLGAPPAHATWLLGLPPQGSGAQAP